MAKFKCNQSGNTVQFFQEHEIAEMRNHGGYVEIIEATEEAKPVVTPAPKKSTKKVIKDEASIDGEQPNSGN